MTGQATGSGRAMHRLERLLEGLLAVTVFVMMTITFVDVVGRYFFNAPLISGFELTEFAVAAVFFLGLPLATARQEHVTVTLFEKISQYRLQKILVDLVCILVMGVLAWRLTLQGATLARGGNTTAFLQVPLAPIAYFMAAMTAASTLILIALLLKHAGLTGERDAGERDNGDKP